MPIAKTFMEIVDDLKSYILNTAPYLDTKEGSPWATCFIEPQASELERLYYLIDFVLSNQSILSATGQYLDALASNVGMSRRKAVAATGTVTFYTSSPVANDVIIPVGTVVSTPQAFNYPSVDFETTSRATIPRGEIQIEASVRARVPGSSGNVGAGEVRRIQTSLYEVSSCKNDYAMTGGVDLETDRAFVERMRSTIFGNDAGTEYGYRADCLRRPGALAAKVIKPDDGDPFSRGPGTVDVVVKGANVQTYTDYISFEEPYMTYALSKQPVTELPNVINIVTASGGERYMLGTYYGGTEPMLVGSQDYTIHRGPKISCNNLENSIYGSDGVRWLSNTPGSGGEGLTAGTRTAERPLDGHMFLVENYSYDKLVEDCQIEVDAGKCVTADALVRKCEMQYLNFNINFVTTNGYDWSDIKNFIAADVRGLVSNVYGIGAKLEFSDVTHDIRNRVSGIDNVQIDSVEVLNEAGYIVGTHARDILFDNVTAVTVGTIHFDNAIVYNAQV